MTQQPQPHPSPQQNSPLVPSSPLSQESQYKIQPKISHTLISETNFVKTMRYGKTQGYQLICIFQEEPFVVQFRSGQTKKQTIFESNDINENANSIWDLSHQNNIIGQLYFQTIPYDCIEASNQKWLISTKNMPPRIYSLCPQNKTLENIGCFSTKKKNSELYLSPLQFASCQQKHNLIIGGGRRFLCSYDLEKLTEQQMYSKFDKVNVSAISVNRNGSIIVGTFEGAVEIIDERQNGAVGEMLRPHVDAVMSIAASPLNEYEFATSARKDNYTYIFDLRSYQSHKFVNQLYLPRYNNQRTSLSYSTVSAKLYTGSQDAEIVCWSYQEQQNKSVQKFKINCNNIINNVVCVNKNKEEGKQEIIFSAGQRVFSQLSDSESQQQRERNRIGKEARKIKQVNMLGYLKPYQKNIDNSMKNQE